MTGSKSYRITANFYSNELPRRKSFLNCLLYNCVFFLTNSIYVPSPFLYISKVEHGFYVGKAIEFISECDIESHFLCAYFCATFTNVEAKNTTRQLKCKKQRIVRINCQGAVDI